VNRAPERARQAAADHAGRDQRQDRVERDRATVLAAIPGRELRWLGKLGLHGIVDGEHYFILTPNEDGTTHLDHGERFSGILVALAKGSAKANDDSGYEAFSQALKQRAESISEPR
jgi:hypothetical protein